MDRGINKVGKAVELSCKEKNGSVEDRNELKRSDAEDRGINVSKSKRELAVAIKMQRIVGAKQYGQDRRRSRCRGSLELSSMDKIAEDRDAEDRWS